MSSIFNQYSYLFGALGMTGGAALILFWLRVRPARIGAVVLSLAALLLVGWLLLRPGLSDVDNLADAEAVIDNGKTTFVEFFSNYCAGCIAVRNHVTGLVDEMRAKFDDDVNVLRVDIHTDFGRALRERYDFSYTPEFVLFDNRGEEAWRNHVPPTLAEIETVMQMNAPHEAA